MEGRHISIGQKAQAETWNFAAIQPADLQCVGVRSATKTHCVVLASVTHTFFIEFVANRSLLGTLHAHGLVGPSEFPESRSLFPTVLLVLLLPCDEVLAYLEVSFG